MIHSDKPIIFFDLETTGKELTSRIVSIYAEKYLPKENLIDLRCNPDDFINFLVNPGIPIPKEATEIHKIKDSDVLNEPKFSDVAKGTYEFFKGCYLAGFNIIRFDMPILSEHFAISNIDFPDADIKFIDAQVIFHRKEERTLAAAHKFYMQFEMTDAHTSDADTIATRNVTDKQIKRYFEDNVTIEALNDFSLNGKSIIDPSGYLIRNDKNEIVFSFGKNKGFRVIDCISYVNWMIKNYFPFTTKNTISKIISGEIK